MFRSLLTKTLRDQRLALIGGAVGLIALSFYLTYVYPYIGRAAELMKFLGKMPPFMRKFVNPEVFASPAGFFNLQPFSVLAPLIFLGYAIARGSDLIAGEEERGTLDLLLSHPIGRGRVLAHKLAAACLTFLLWAAALWLGMVAGCAAFSIRLSRLRLLQAVGSCFALALTFLCLTLAVGCLTGRKKASAAGVSAFAVLAYLIQAFAPMVESLRPFQAFSPFYYYNGNQVLLNGLRPGHVAIQAACALICAGLALLFFYRRNLHV